MVSKAQRVRSMINAIAFIIQLNSIHIIMTLISRLHRRNRSFREIQRGQLGDELSDAFPKQIIKGALLLRHLFTNV